MASYKIIYYILAQFCILQTNRLSFSNQTLKVSFKTFSNLTILTWYDSWKCLVWKISCEPDITLTGQNGLIRNRYLKVYGFGWKK